MYPFCHFRVHIECDVYPFCHSWVHISIQQGGLDVLGLARLVRC